MLYIFKFNGPGFHINEFSPFPHHNYAIETDRVLLRLTAHPVVVGSRDALRVLAAAGHKAGYILTTCGQTNTAVARIDTPTDGIRRVGI